MILGQLRKAQADETGNEGRVQRQRSFALFDPSGEVSGIHRRQAQVADVHNACWIDGDGFSLLLKRVGHVPPSQVCGCKVSVAGGISRVELDQLRELVNRFVRIMNREVIRATRPVFFAVAHVIDF